MVLSGCFTFSATQWAPLQLNAPVQFTDRAKLATRQSQAKKKNTIFFLRLPNGQYGPVSQLSRSEKCCTGPFNWGEAHCAGENVKRRTGPFLRKSPKNQKQEQQHDKGRSRPRQPGTPRPGSQVHGPKTATKAHRRLHRQIQVRLNVHRNALNDALIQ